MLSGPMTRVASSDASIWIEIFKANKESIQEPLQETVGALQEFYELLEEDRYEAIQEIMETGQTGHRDLEKRRWNQ